MAPRRRARGAHAGVGVRTPPRAPLFALEHRWHPYHDQLPARCASWKPLRAGSEGELAELLLRLVRDADPTFQQELELRVEALLESRGIAHQWGPEDDLQPLKEHRFR